MSIWRATSRFALTVWNFNPPQCFEQSIPYLPLLIGEPVHIESECDDWFYGYSLVRPNNINGIFPKCCAIVQDYDSSSTASRKNTFEQDVILTLHQWVNELKQNFAKRNTEVYDEITRLIDEAIHAYQPMRLGKLTADELRLKKEEIISKFAYGNRLLKLDTIIRLRSGQRIDPFETSIVEYFHHHQECDEQTNKRLQSVRNSATLNEHFLYGNNNKVRRNRHSTSIRNSNCSYESNSSFDATSLNNQTSPTQYNICVWVLNFICTIRQDMDIMISLYDTKESKFIYENFTIKWDRQGLVRDIDKLDNIRAVFTDFSANDFNRKLFLVAQVVRIGSMTLDQHRSLQRKALQYNGKIKDHKVIDELRRPCGVGLYDMTQFLANPNPFDEPKELFIPFYMYTEKDSLDSLIKKLIKDSAKEGSTVMGKSQGFCISLRAVTSTKMQLIEHTSYVVKKIGFPDVILPEDLRNDLYLSLISGDFSKGRNKTTERNIECQVRVFRNDGTLVENALNFGTEQMNSMYKSVVYYHEDRPRWMENVRLSLSIEDFRSCHLKFLFKHRSSNENKDKNEKPFAMAFIKLMNCDGTTLKNREYNLSVYKVDGKKYNDQDLSYLALNPCSNDLVTDHDNPPNKHFQLSPKDLFTISILVCSTKLAQNINIFGLLNWREKREELENVLQGIQKLDGDDVIKFLNDSLDSLFEIWMEVSQFDDPETDSKAFQGLVKIIRLLLEPKYMHFKQILVDYIEKHFSATLIYPKMIICFRSFIYNPEHPESYHTVQCMEYIFKFIVRSRTLFSIINDEAMKEEFVALLNSFFENCAQLMRMPNTQCDEKTRNEIMKVKLAVLKFFPKIISDVVTVYDAKQLTRKLVEILENVMADDSVTQKLICIHEIVQTDIFTKMLNCRRIILPTITGYIKGNMLRYDTFLQNENSYIERLSKCLQILSEVLVILANQETRYIRGDIRQIASCLLETMVEVFHFLKSKNNSLIVLQQLLSVMLNLMLQMNDLQYNDMFDEMFDFMDFAEKLLKMFQLCTKSVFPVEWADMNLMQNVVILKAMDSLSKYIRLKNLKSFQKSQNFLYQIFTVSVSFITQPSLQLESFSRLKRFRIESFGRDMRCEMVKIVRTLWFYLGELRSKFVPKIIGPLLEVALVPVAEIRQNTMVMIFDMFIYCFDQNIAVRNEVITHLDRFITEGKGDHEFKQLFVKNFLANSENHTVMLRDSCKKFVQEVSEQIEKLLIYRDVVKDDSFEYIMSCVVDLLDFYEAIDRRELYIRYLYKLYDLHIHCENYSEAAYTLSRHGMLLEWSDKKLDSLLRNEKYQKCETHRELKEKLYFEIMDNFARGELWEAGIVFCQELIEQYERVFFDYVKLSDLFMRMSKYYSLIVSTVRPEPEYFQVTYYGNGFPEFFRQKTFIFKGKGYERLQDFSKRLQSQFPAAKLLRTLDEPEDSIVNSDEQHLSIFKVDPLMREDVKAKFVGQMVDEKIVKYYQYNQICDFTFARMRIKNKDSGNEFANMWIDRTEFHTVFLLPGILCRAEVIQKKKTELSPIQNAIDTMEKSIERTRTLLLRYLNSSEQPMHILVMHVKGIISSDVQGGFSKYEEAFFNDDDELCPEEEKKKLKDLIAAQIPMLELAMRIWSSGSQSGNSIEPDPLYLHTYKVFQEMKKDVENKYGTRELPADIKKFVELRPLKSNRMLNNSQQIVINRNSAESHQEAKPTTRRKTSMFVGSTSNLTATLRLRKKHNRNASNADAANSVYSSNANLSQSQWYTPGTTNHSTSIQSQVDTVSESSFEQSSNTSRPGSGQFNSRVSLYLSVGGASGALSSSNLNLGMTPEANESETPPPLPVKKCASEANFRMSLRSTSRSNSHPLSPTSPTEITVSNTIDE